MAASSREAASVVVKQSSDANQEVMTKMRYLPASKALEMQLEQVKQLPDSKRWSFGYGPLILSFNAGLVGLIGNSFFRRMLMVRKGLVLSSLPSALMPALIMAPAWMKFITNPILLGDLNCTVCANIRGGLINFLLGAVYPVVLAAPLSAALAKRYDTIKVPTVSIRNFDRRGFVEFWARKTRYFKGQFITITIFQTVLGMYIAGSQIQVAKEELSKKLMKIDP